MKKSVNLKASSVTDNQDQVLIPMIVDKDSLKEMPMAGVTQANIRKWRVGNRIVDVVLVPGTREQYDSIVGSYSSEFKKEDRDCRCKIGNGQGKLIRCPEDRKCSECPYYNSLDKKSFSTATFSSLIEENEEGDLTEYEPKTPEGYGQAERYARMLCELIDYTKQIDPDYERIIPLLVNNVSRREIAKILGKPKSTIIDKAKKLEPIVTEFLDNLIY